MNRREFLSELEERLAVVHDEDRERTLAIYRRLIDSAIEEGTSEEDIIATIDTPEQIARRYIEGLPLKELVKSEAVKRELNVSGIALLIFLLPLGIGAAVAALALYVSMWAVVAAVYLAAVAAGVIGIMLLTASFDVIRHDFLRAAAFFGAGLALMGLAVFVFVFGMWLTKQMKRLTHYGAKLVKRQFIKRGLWR